MPLSGPPVHHISFLEMDDATFAEYAEYLINSDVASDARVRALAYLQHTTSQDKDDLRVTQAALNTNRIRQIDQQDRIGRLFVASGINFATAHAEVFNEPPVWTDAEILAKLTQDNAEVFIRDRDITGTVVLSGNEIKFAGLGTRARRWAATLRTRAS